VSDGTMVAIVDYLEDEEDDTFEVKALLRALIGEMKEISEITRFSPRKCGSI
jgi:ATP-dependent Lon protease